MKKQTVLVLIVLWAATLPLAFFVGTKYTNTSYEKIQANEVERLVTENDTASDFVRVVEIPIAEIEAYGEQNQDGITRQEAELLCRNVLGDTAEENGAPLSYRCIGAVSADGKLYYVMHITWLVDNNYWSYIGNCYVSSDGKEIYDGVVSPAKYTINTLRWQE